MCMGSVQFEAVDLGPFLSLCAWIDKQGQALPVPTVVRSSEQSFLNIHIHL